MRIENSFIPVEGVGELTERRLWEAGITHWGAFYPDAVGPTTAERIESFIEEAERRLDAGDAHFFGRRFPSRSRWRLYENFREETCFLDIETTGLSPARDAVTVVSIHRGGETATLVRGDDLTVDRLRDELSTASLLVTFNGAQFDVPFLES
ncbi:MAG: ribonuclease H-like domain-containing protein, partial [Halobacteriota archaeon]